MQKEQAKEENKLDECVICYCKSDQVHIMCPSNHGYCSEDLNALYEDMVIKGKNIKNTCTLCNQPFFDEKLKILLSDDVQFAMQNLNILEEFKVPEYLYLMTCPLCPNKNKAGKFVVDKEDYIQYYHCEVEGCKKCVCLYCREECKDKISHSNCLKYLNEVKDLEKLIEYSILSFCPKCKVREIESKDLKPRMKGGCTHISCNRCNMQYCYICGGHQENVNKSNANKSLIYRHNDDWKTLENRCPMYLNEFQTIIPEFSANEEEATSQFLEYKKHAYMKILINKYGLQKLKNCYEHFKKNRLRFFDECLLDIDYSKVKTYEQIDKKIMQFYKIN